LVGHSIDLIQANQLLAKLEQERTQLRKNLEEKRAAIKSIVEKAGEGAQFMFNAKSAQHIASETRLQEAATELQRNRDELAHAMKNPRVTAKDFARVDVAMAQMQAVHEALEREAERLEAQFGKGDPAVIDLRARIVQRSKAMDNYCDNLQKKYFIKTAANAKQVLFPKDLSPEEAEVKAMNDRWDAEKEALDDLGHAAHQLIVLRPQAKKIQDQLDSVQKQMDELADKRSGKGIRDSLAVIVIGASDALKESQAVIDATFASIKSQPNH
jgi:hypothetical protein